MASYAYKLLAERQEDVVVRTSQQEDGVDGEPWWNSHNGTIVKWTIFSFFVALFLCWALAAYLRHRRSGGRSVWASLRDWRNEQSVQEPQIRPHSPRRDWRGWYGGEMLSEEASFKVPPPVYDPARPPAYTTREERHGIQITTTRTTETMQPTTVEHEAKVAVRASRDGPPEYSATHSPAARSLEA